MTQCTELSEEYVNGNDTSDICLSCWLTELYDEHAECICAIRVCLEGIKAKIAHMLSDAGLISSEWSSDCLATIDLPRGYSFDDSYGLNNLVLRHNDIPIEADGYLPPNFTTDLSEDLIEEIETFCDKWRGQRDKVVRFHVKR